MADEGESLVGQQLAAANRIPYENIKANQTGIEMAMNAFQVAQGVKLKRMELEGKMQSLVEKNRQMELMGELREKEFGLRLATAQQTADFKSGAADRAWQVLGIRKEAQDYKEQRDTDKNTDTMGLFQDIGSITSEKGTPEWEKDVTKVFATHPNVPASSRNVIARQVWGQHQNAYDTKIKALDAEEKNIRHGLSYDLFGVGNKGDVAVLETPERFVQNYAVKKKGKDQAGAVEGQIDPDTGKPYELKVGKDGQYVATPYKSFRFVDPTDTSKVQYKPIAVKRLNDYTNSIKANRDARAKLGDRPHNPEVGITRNQPSDYDIETLKNNPQLKRKFEARFGDGSANPYIQQSNDE